MLDMVVEQGITLETFSDEILVHLLSFLDLKDLLELKKVSSTLKRIGEDEGVIVEVLKNTLANDQISGNALSTRIKRSMLNKALRSLSPENIPQQLAIPYLDALISYNNPEQSNTQKVKDLTVCLNMVTKMTGVYSDDMFGINKIKQILFPNIDIFSLASIKTSTILNLPIHLRSLINFCAYIAIGAYGSIELKDISGLLLLRIDQYNKINNKSTYNSLIQGLKKLHEPRLLHKFVKAVTNPTVFVSLNIGLAILLDKQTLLNVGPILIVSGFALFGADIYLDQSRRALNALEFKVTCAFFSPSSNSLIGPIDDDFNPDEDPSSNFEM